MVFVLVAIGALHTLGSKRLVSMATGTDQLGMAAQQREAAEIVVKPDIGLPVGAVMAAPTRLAKLAFMYILGRMAGGAFDGQLQFASRTGMAGLAFRLGVLSGQGELRHRVVIEVGQFPRRFHMAPRAVHAVSALVRIICGMAAEAGGRRLDQLCRLLVASLAGGRAMGTLQREFGQPVMVEAGLFPVARVMARCAISAVLPLVCVITRVAGVAGARGMLVGIPLTVAPCTGCLGMATDQGKSGSRMIESCRAPSGGCVARCAICTPASLVGIVARMATDAGSGDTFPALTSMARHASRLPMCAGKRKTSS